MTAIQTVQNGDYLDPNTWNLGVVPTIDHYATVNEVHNVFLHSMDPEPMTIEVGGVTMLGTCDFDPPVVIRTVRGVVIPRSSKMRLSYSGYTVEGV